MRYPATLHHPHVTFIITFELGLLLLLTAAVEADMYVSGAGLARLRLPPMSPMLRTKCVLCYLLRRADREQE